MMGPRLGGFVRDQVVDDGPGSPGAHFGGLRGLGHHDVGRIGVLGADFDAVDGAAFNAVSEGGYPDIRMA